MKDTMTTARALYGHGWHDLPEFVKEAAAGFVADLLDLDALDISETLRGCGSDRVSECADAAVPIYRSELLALLADVGTADTILAAADGLGGVQAEPFCRDTLSRLVALGCYGVLSDAFATMLAAVETADGFEAFGLDADAAEVAAALLPEWSGTVRELVEAAPRLATEGVTR
jgi:hypothetical protein